MGDGNDEFDELNIADDAEAIEFMETMIEQKASEIQLIKNPDGSEFKYKGLSKF